MLNTTDMPKTTKTLNADTAHSVITSALAEYPGPKKTAGPTLLVCCPFHDEKEPSCGVVVSTESTVPLGVFHCLGCNAKGGWNKFAQKTGLPEIQEWKFYDSDLGSAFSLLTKQAQASLLGTFGKDGTKEDLYSKIETKAAIPWPKHKEWRGYSGKLMSKLGALYINDERMDELMLALPISVNGRIRGAVRAVIEKRSKKQSSYLTSKGKWVKKYGLFPFDYVKNEMVKKKKLRYVVLVEGPRDALSLIRYGIPALAILGVQNLTKEKIVVVMSMFKSIEILYYMPDRDKGGTLMSKTMKQLTKGLVPSQKIELPEILNEEGKPLKIDPDNCPGWYMDQVVNYLKDLHH
jgi:5S rRNA maturation endonuclease (ribonuclease M5)